MTSSIVTIVYRIASETPDYPAGDMTGGGASKTGGRWNAPGAPMVYCAQSRALAYLETLAQLMPALVPGTKPPGNCCLIEVEIPNAIWEQRTHAQRDPMFAGDWNVHPPGKGSIAFGTAWLAAKASAMLIVPSVVVPKEDNILINPRHPDARTITAINTGVWPFDSRLFP